MFNGGHDSNWTHRALKPGWWKSCFDFGGAILQFSISGSIYQSFLNPPSWAAQLTIITLRIKVIVICCIWNLFLKKKQGLALKGVFLKGFCLEEIEMSYNSEWGEEEMEDEERWIPQNEEDGIFKMRKRDGRWNWTSIISGDWPDWQDGSQQSVSDSISLFPYFVIVQPLLLAPLCSKYLLHIYSLSNRPDMGSPSNSSESSWRAGATTESKRWPIRTFLIFLNISQ